MKYKPDWEETQQRFLAWWNHEIIDRCCIAVHAPKEGAPVKAPDLQHGPWLLGMNEIEESDQTAIERWWKDPELNYQRAITWFENTYFAGEALPVTYVNWGAMAMAAMFGAPLEFNNTSVWYPQVIKNWDDWQWDFDPTTDPTWKTIKAIVERLLQEAEGQYFVGSPELGNGADILSLIRGMDNLAMDCVLYPDKVKEGVEVISDAWVALMEEIHQMTTTANAHGNLVAWMGIWAPGRTDQIACDFSSVISPQMFQEFFVPEILKMGNWCEYGVYHLDGPDCMKNMLDILLEIEQIKTIQFTPGTGSAPTYTEAYLPRYRKILESGKNLYLLVEPDEVEKILREVPPEGLFMRTYVNSETEADEMLKNVAKWSTKKWRASK